MKKILLTLCMSLLSVSLLAADDAADKFSAKIGGRFLLDGIVYPSAPDTLHNQANITDLRLTGKMTYGDWFMRIDVGFDGNRLGMKDTFLQYAKNDNCFRIGHMIGSFGIDPSVSTYDNIFNACANINNIFYFGRHMGMSYTRTGKQYYASAGIFFGDNLKVNANTRQGINTALRGVWRPINEEGKVVQAGISGLFRHPDKDKSTGLSNITLSATGVTCLNSPDYQYISFDDARNESQVGAEIYLSWKKWMVQAEYMAMFINRFNASTYFAHGGYVMAGYLIKGDSFGYDYGEALPTAPASPKSLQLVARYNISCLNDHRIGMFGGNEQDISVGLNYQFNKYVCSRLNWSYVKLEEHSPLGAANLHMMQARVAFWF